MSTITTAAELDALPVGSVVARLHDDGRGNSVYTLHWDGWYSATEPLRPWLGQSPDEYGGRMVPLTVLYRPDQPEPVKPSREAVRQAIEAAFGPTWDSAVEQGLDAAADAVLALIPAIPGQNPAELAAHDAQVAGRALRRAYIELRTELDHFPLHGRHTRAAWAAQRLLTYADRAAIRAEAQR